MHKCKRIIALYGEEFMQIKRDQNQLDKISKRLRQMRAKSGLSISQLREKIMEKEDVSFSSSAYCRWENAQRMPPMKVIEALSGYFDVSAEWLSGASDAMKATVEGIAFNQTIGFKSTFIPKEELYMHRGEPVWTPSYGGKWALIQTNEDVLLFANGNKISFHELQIDLFRVPIPYYYTVDSSMDPIPLNSLNKHEKIWIEPITKEFSERQGLKGWANKSSDMKNFENPITHMKYKLSEYGITWIAYEDIIK